MRFQELSQIFIFILAIIIFSLAPFTDKLHAYHRDQTERESLLEDFLLSHDHPRVFFGYYKNYFEYCRMKVGNGCVEPFVGRAGAHYFSLHERPTVNPTTGNSQHPVHHMASFQGLQGLSFPNGENFFGSVDARSSPYSWIYADMGAQAGVSANHRKTWYHLQRAYVDLRLNSFVLSVGRKPIRWGQSYVGPLLISDNATPFDIIQLSTLPVRVQVPPLSWLGELKAETFLTRTNEDRDPGKDWFLGWRLGTRAHLYFEFNVAMLYQFGGRRVAGGSFSESVIEFFGGRADYGDDPHASSNLTNRAASIDFRWTFPNKILPFSFYSEHLLEDCCGSFEWLFTESYSYLYGLELPGIFQSTSLALEAARIQGMTYFHLSWPSALSNDGSVAGHPLGGNSMGYYAKIRKTFSEHSHTVTVFYEERQINAEFLGRSIREVFYPPYRQGEKSFGLRGRSMIEINKFWEIDLSANAVSVWSKNYTDNDSFEWSTSLGANFKF